MLAPSIRRTIPFAFVAFTVVLFIGLPWFLHLHEQNRDQVLRLSTGQDGGVYQPLAAGIASVVSNQHPRLQFELMDSEGSLANLQRLESDACDLALIQNGTPGGESVRMIAPLYLEVLHVMVRTDAPFQRLADLRKAKLAAGPAGSGTQQIAHQLFAHYGLDQGGIEAAYMPVKAACAALIDGKVDAVMLVSGIDATAIRDTLSSGKVRLLGIGEAGRIGGEVDGFRLHHPHLKPFVIPRLTYRNQVPGEQGFPREPVQTLAVPSLLVCKESLGRKTVRDMTETLFEQRVALSKVHVVASQIHEPASLIGFSYPLHPGAESYYRRHEPNFFVEYAEVIALLMSVLATGFGALLAVRKWAGLKQKDRIDLFLARLDEMLEEIHANTSSHEQLVEMDEELVRMRHDALRQLVREKIQANDAFQIFQTLLANTRREIEDQVAQQVEDMGDEEPVMEKGDLIEDSVQ